MVHDGIVLINIGISIHAYDTVSGDELWQYKLWQYNMNQDSNSIPAVGGNRVFISSGWGFMLLNFYPVMKCIPCQERWTVERRQYTMVKQSML